VEDVSKFKVVFDRIATVPLTKLGISKEILPETSEDIQIMENSPIWDCRAGVGGYWERCGRKGWSGHGGDRGM
jgi:hypothetical protein